MKHKITGFILLLTMVLSLFPMASLAVGGAELGTYSWSGTWETTWGNMILTQSGASVSGTYEHDDGKIIGTVSGNTLTGTWSEYPSYAPPEDAGDFVFEMTTDGKGFGGEWRYGSDGGWGTWDGGTRLTALTLVNDHEYTTSTWATEPVQKAFDLGLIPDVLMSSDLTKLITRLEFAAVCVKVYENLSATKAIPAVVNPFKDTSDLEVLKAYNVGITTGLTADTFGPNVVLNREQAATMLTRVFKRVTIPGWTFATDGNFTLNYTKPAAFADDAQISGWAKPSVYFMAANGIINGIGNNTFAPNTETTDEQAKKFANATGEQALIIAVGIVEKLKGKTADYTEK